MSYWVVSYTIMLFGFFELHAREQPRTLTTDAVRSWFFLLACLLLVVFGGSRNLGVGMDDGQYLAFYRQFSAQLAIMHFGDVTALYRYESIFPLVAAVVSLFTQEAHVFLFIICLLAVSTNAWCYRQFSPLMICSLCIYSTHLFLNKDMNQIRFGLCSAFAVAALLLAYQQKWLSALLLLLFSTQSHATGYALLLAMPFLFIRQQWKYLPLLIVLLALPIGFIGGKRLLLDTMSTFLSFGQRLKSYEGTRFDVSYSLFAIANLKNILFIAAFTAIYWWKKPITREDSLAYLLLIVYALGAAIRIMFSDFAIVGGRVGNLFLHVEPLLIAHLMVRLRYIIVNALLLFAVASYYLAYNTLLNVQSVHEYSVAPLFYLF